MVVHVRRGAAPPNGLAEPRPLGKTMLPLVAAWPHVGEARTSSRARPHRAAHVGDLPGWRDVGPGQGGGWLTTAEIGRSTVGIEGR